MHPQKIELALPADLEFSSFLREASSDIFQHSGFTPEWTNRLKLVLDELFNNAIKYGSGENGMIYINFILNENDLSFEVEDEGKGREKISAEELQLKIEKNMQEVTDMTKDCGRGLAVIAFFWADELIIKNSVHGGISIAFKKRIVRENLNSTPQLPLEEWSVSEMIQIANLEGGLDARNFEEKIKPINEMIENLPEKAVLILDCSGLEYFNSNFIAQLATWHKAAQKRGSQILMKNTNPEATKILDLVGLKPLIYSRN